MSSEAALVSENLVFGQYHADKEAQRSTLYPFIRNAVSAMDFGGVFFNKHFSKDGVSGTLRKTTDAFQIATSVLYQSGIQHFGITPNNLTEQPEFILDFMKKVPTVWDETRFIDGYPGKYCAVARRYGNQWYIARHQCHRATHETEFVFTVADESGKFPSSMITKPALPVLRKAPSTKKVSLPSKCNRWVEP